MSEPFTETSFREQMLTLRNWGRWGDADDAGTLNHITGESVRRAAGLVSEGRVVACGRTIDAAAGSAQSPVVHFMTLTGQDALAAGQSSARDWLGLPLHGPGSTHLDAFGHQFYDGLAFGGAPAGSAVTSSGAASGDIVPAARGIVSRGVLLDVPRARGCEFVDADDVIGLADLARCEAAGDVRVAAGDVLFVRTGRDKGPSQEASDGSRRHTGLDARIAPWLQERRVAVLVSDVDSECRPPRQHVVHSPMHAFALVAMGLWLLDNADLEALAETCAALQRWQFLAMISPLRIRGGTASPVNPLAVF